MSKVHPSTPRPLPRRHPWKTVPRPQEQLIGLTTGRPQRNHYPTGTNSRMLIHRHPNQRPLTEFGLGHPSSFVSLPPQKRPPSISWETRRPRRALPVLPRAQHHPQATPPAPLPSRHSQNNLTGFGPAMPWMFLWAGFTSILEVSISLHSCFQGAFNCPIH